MSITFSLTVLAWIFFRAENIDHAWSYLSEIFSKSLFTVPHFRGMRNALTIIILILIFIIIEWLGREEQYAIEKIGFKKKQSFRYIFYYVIILLIMWFGGQQQQFIYFQF